MGTFIGCVDHYPRAKRGALRRSLHGVAAGGSVPLTPSSLLRRGEVGYFFNDELQGSEASFWPWEQLRGCDVWVQGMAMRGCKK